MKKSTRPYPAVRVDTQGVGAVAHAGGVWLTRTAQSTGLSGSPSQELAPRRKPTAVHDPAKVRTDLALSLVLGGDALADAALLRAELDVSGMVGSEATISRTITALAADAPLPRPVHRLLATRNATPTRSDIPAIVLPTCQNQPPTVTVTLSPPNTGHPLKDRG